MQQTVQVTANDYHKQYVDIVQKIVAFTCDLITKTITYPDKIESFPAMAQELGACHFGVDTDNTIIEDKLKSTSGFQFRRHAVTKTGTAEKTLTDTAKELLVQLLKASPIQ